MSDAPAPEGPDPWSGGFVGRVDEVSVLRQLVDEVVAGRGRSVLVEGEPGIGKSSVLAAGLSGARELGCQVFWCSADASRERLPLRVLADGLGVDLDELLPDELPAGPGTGDLVPAMVKSLLERVDRLCAVAPSVLVLDDLHNADEASLLAWNRLNRSLVQLPLLLAAAARPVPARAEVAGLRRALLARGAVGLSLGPLPEPQVVELVGGLVHAAVGPRLRRLASGAGGNPLFLREAVDARLREGRIRVDRGVAELVEEDATVAPPISLAGAIEGRLRSLSADSVPLLRLAALLGAEFAVVDLTTVAGRPATEVVAAVEEAVAAGVLVESGARLAFRHPLIRQALYEMTPPGGRAALHRQAARSLAVAGAPAERVAQLLLAAAPPVEDWVLDWLDDGAVGTLTLRAPNVAAELTERALDQLPDDDPRRERLGASLVTVLRLLARYDDVYRVARPLLAEATDPSCAGQTAWTLAYALLSSGRRPEAFEVTEQALDRWPAVVPWAARLRALLALLILDHKFQLDVATETAELAVAEGEQVGDRFAVGFGLHVLAVTTASTGDALALVERGLTVVADFLESADLRLLMYANKTRYLRILGRMPDAERTLREALALAERTGTPRLLTLRSVAAITYYYLGRWDDALVELEIALEVLEDRPVADYEWLHVHGLAALIAAHRDDRATMELHMADTPGSSRSDALVAGDDFRRARALVAERDGRFDAALAELVMDLGPEDGGRDRDRQFNMPVLVRLALATGDLELARRATEQCELEVEGPSAAAAAHHCRGLLGVDVAELHVAVDGYRKVGAIPRLAGCLEDLAVSQGERGDVQAARAAYAEAVELYRGLGARCDLARARSRMRPYDIGGGPHGELTRPAFGWYALTPTERKIARLVADGLSNPDIAAALFLSRRTVQSHVSHILTKLDVRSRAEIAEEVTRHPTVAAQDSAETAPSE